MRHDTFQQTARAAFSLQDWLLLLDDSMLRQRYGEIATIEDVEAFVFDAYDRLRALRPKASAGAASPAELKPVNV